MPFPVYFAENLSQFIDLQPSNPAIMCEFHTLKALMFAYTLRACHVIQVIALGLKIGFYRGIDLKHGELVQVEVASGASVAVYELPPSSIRWDTDGTYIYQLIDAEPGAQRPYRAKVQRVALVDETAETALFTAALDETGLYATTGSFKLKEGVLAQLGDRAN